MNEAADVGIDHDSFLQHCHINILVLWQFELKVDPLNEQLV